MQGRIEKNTAMAYNDTTVHSWHSVSRFHACMKICFFIFLKRNTGILFQIEGSLILFDFIMSETQLFKEDYHS